MGFWEREERIIQNRLRRNRQLRTRLLLAVLALAAGSGFLGGRMILTAQDKDAPVSYKYFTSVPVAEGDTLWSLSDAYTGGGQKERMAFMQEVIRTNHLLDEQLQAGDWLIIPYYSEEFRQ